MPDASFHSTPLDVGRGDGPPPARGRRVLRWLAGTAALAVLVVAAAALIPGSHSSHGTERFSVAAVAPRASGPPVKARVGKVFGSDIPAARYGTEISKRENGIGANGQIASDLSPVAPSAFRRPIAAYRNYAERWSIKLAGAVATLRAGLAADDRGLAQRDWATAFADYLHLGAVYGLIPAPLDRHLAGLPQTLGNRQFPGLHRIELGLWTGAAPRSLLPVAAALAGAVTQLRRTLPTVAIDTLDYTLRAHEILEDAQRDFMSGADVPWSGAGVLGTEEDVVATREVISTLVPLLQGRDNTLVEAQNWLGQLQGVLISVRRPGGGWPAVDQLSTTQRERIDGSLAGTLGALAEIPGTLETADVPVIPSIAAEEARR
jgi:hypothetical protein